MNDEMQARPDVQTCASEECAEVPKEQEQEKQGDVEMKSDEVKDVEMQVQSSEHKCESEEHTDAPKEEHKQEKQNGAEVQPQSIKQKCESEVPACAPIEEHGQEKQSDGEEKNDGMKDGVQMQTTVQNRASEDHAGEPKEEHEKMQDGGVNSSEVKDGEHVKPDEVKCGKSGDEQGLKKPEKQGPTGTPDSGKRRNSQKHGKKHKN